MIVDISKNGANVSGKAAVLEWVDNLLNTTKYSRMFNRGLHSDLEELLFQPPSYVNSKILKSSVTSLIYRELSDYVDNVIVDVHYQKNSRVYGLTINIVHSGDSEPIVYRRQLEAG